MAQLHTNLEERNIILISLSSLNKPAALKAFSLLSRMRIYADYWELMRTDKADYQTLEEIQIKKRNRIVDMAKRNVPYYSNIFGGIEKFENLPLTSKSDLKRHSMKSLMNHQYAGGFSKKQTGGSTGEPLVFYACNGSRSISWALYYRFVTRMGLSPPPKTVTLWGGSTTASPKMKIKKLVKRFVIGLVHIDAFSISEQKLYEYLDLIRNIQPDLLRGYVSALARLADVVEDSEELEIKAVTPTSEVLASYQRRKIREAFGCPVYDQYGMGEVQSIASECPAHEGLHINMEHVYLEIIRDGKPCAPGEKGEIVLTNLDNELMPFIRYRTGDFGSVSLVQCECGRSSPRIKSIVGRISDIIKAPNGSAVHGEFFTHLLEELGFIQRYKIKRFQVRQTEIDCINFMIVAQSRLSTKSKKRLVQMIQRALPGIRVQLLYPNRIPLGPSGKHRFTISEI